jgi:hypothetical protein
MGKGKRFVWLVLAATALGLSVARAGRPSADPPAATPKKRLDSLGYPLPAEHPNPRRGRTHLSPRHGQP